MKLLVAIHDVTPAFEPEISELWARCARRDIQPALFVVPNWHGEWPLERFPRFVRWLLARAADGAEIFVHGERHDELGSSRRLAEEFRALGRTDGEAEFLVLDEVDARTRMARGLAVLRRCGLHPVGFVPPAWLWRPGTAGIVASLGLPVSEDDGAVYLHQRATKLESPVLRWSVRTRARALLSAAVVAAQSRWYDGHWLMRIALHPKDLTHEATASSVEHMLDYWRARRHPWRYAML